ncbi:hypothetical protein IHE45_10G007200 [Dioscorea alata]|uniref:Uncharacterized protein n=3 Tax=Dioscorea alata TaxID=55571 RepID=A0ACB7V995_DIOAL|nr:hypothetical protein IHE45_10G007200 [Dioscorea alata]KAH7670166.1 hypothetical protein IHE45_10G007200 [Dioscorea alata]KAH7670167.1 hypothetical protein IHE45_10G007200 [Dioscorea alata]
MAENSDEPQTLVPQEALAHTLKRKADLDSVEEFVADCKGKLPKLDSSPAAGLDGNGVEKFGSESEEVIAEVVDRKGKGKVVVEVEDDDDGDDSSSESTADGIMGDEDDSDFDDDPLAEVDLDNILPSRTRRRAPPPPGAYLVTDQDEDDDEDDEDNEVDGVEE